MLLEPLLVQRIGSKSPFIFMTNFSVFSAFLSSFAATEIPSTRRSLVCQSHNSWTFSYDAKIEHNAVLYGRLSQKRRPSMSFIPWKWPQPWLRILQNLIVVRLEPPKSWLIEKAALFQAAVSNLWRKLWVRRVARWDASVSHDEIYCLK